MIKVIVLLGFGIPGLLILAFALLIARSRSAIVICGTIASALMGFQCLALYAMISSGQAWNGGSVGAIPALLLVGFGVVISAYFVVGLYRTRKNDDVNGKTDERPRERE